MTDGSSFGLKKNGIFSFPLLPKNETDCYILQQNATGSNYFFTRFFCYIPLPYICEYECNYFISILVHMHLYYFKDRIIISNEIRLFYIFSVPFLQENISFYVKEVGTTQVVFSWNNLSGWNKLNKWLNLGYKIIIKYYLDYTEGQHFESIPPNTTEKAITHLSPGHVYRFSLFAINEWEAKTTLSPIFIVETRKLRDT